MTSVLQRGFLYEAEGKNETAAMVDVSADQCGVGDGNRYAFVSLFDAKRNGSAGMGLCICAGFGWTWGACCRRICERIRETWASDRSFDCTDVVLGEGNYRFDFSSAAESNSGDYVVRYNQLAWFVHFVHFS